MVFSLKVQESFTEGWSTTDAVPLVKLSLVFPGVNDRVKLHYFLAF